MGKTDTMGDKALWAYHAVNALYKEYTNDGQELFEDEEHTDLFESRLDQIFMQLTDEEYEEYLELVMENEDVEEDENDWL